MLREIEEQQVRPGMALAEENRREEGAERRRRAERLDVDPVGDHGERHRHERQSDDAGGRGQDTIESRRRPDTEIDDAGACPDERGTVRPVATVEPPPDRADDDARADSAEAAHHRRDPVAIEGKLEQIARGAEQRGDPDAEEDTLADPLLGGQR